MPKRRRSQFEPIATEAYRYENSNYPRFEAQAWQRSMRRWFRVDRRIQRQTDAIGNNAPLYRELVARERDEQLYRSFGFNRNWHWSQTSSDPGSWNDRMRFFVRTGRLDFVTKKWQEAIDRRRREAYVRLRSWLPMEVVRRILQLTPSGSGMYGSVSGRFVVGAPRELLN